MHTAELQAALRDLPLGGFRFFESTGSTNDEALEWAQEDAPDLAVVIADAQTGGRGRLGRRWYTPAQTALAFSLILRPTPAEMRYAGRVTGLGALALADAVSELGLQPQVKWPNDVLIGGKKAAGILVEAAWAGDTPEAFVLGMGVNVRPASVPPPERVSFPATSIETELGREVDRLQLVHGILFAMLGWRSRLGADEFVRAWESSLAFRGEEVQLMAPPEPPWTGKVLGLAPDGSLRVEANDKILTVRIGEIQLRPAL